MRKNRQCPAMSKRTGERCKRFCAMGERTCRFHGSATRKTKTAAAKRIAQASGYAADMLVEFMADPGVDVQLRTRIAQDLLNRSGVNATTIVQLEKGKSFEDVLEGVLIDVDGDEPLSVSESPNVIDAVVVDDDMEAREQERDRRAAERAERKRIAPQQRQPSVSNEERAAQERELLAQAPPEPETRASRLTREQYLLARERGANFSSRGLGADADEADNGTRRARSSRARSGRADLG